MTCGLCGTNEAAGYLCPGCTLATGVRLDGMPRLYEALAGFLHPGGRRPEFGRTRPAEAPLPIVEPAFNLRGPGGIVGVLEDWRSAMQAERGWGEPLTGGTIARRIVVASRALSINLEWIAASWDMAGQLAVEVRQLERSVAAIVDPQDPDERPLELGACPVVLDEDTVCGAVLLRRPSQAAVQCTWCGSSWPPSRWLDLAKAQQAVEEEQREVLLAS
jgi:hypothetical protein